jgi:alpha-L-fucosidase
MMNSGLPLNRREMLLGSTAAAMAGGAASAQPVSLAPTWQSLAATYRVPEWFRDAKFGIWAHWGPQCQPEHGDWYARFMYLEARSPWMRGETDYQHHLKHYGHPSRTGFLDVIGQWKAEEWQPEYLLRRYREAGARYFFAMGCHHDNFDLFASSHHGWNSTRVGPRRDIVGTWAPVVREAGLKFGVSNHSSHAWHWYQVAYGYDAEGPLRGRRYDAYWLRKKHGKGKFWEGLDPQDLYTGPYYVPPDGITSAAAMTAWHDQRDGQWIEAVPPSNMRFVDKWLLRQKEIVEKYRPDLVYLDDSGVPFGTVGLEAVAHYYAKAREWHGDIDVVLFAKKLGALERRAIVEDVERGFVDDIRPEPWQTDTCIGNWHYDRRLYEQNGYKSARQVIQRLVDVVSKNGNLLLNIPVRGNGTIDAREEAILDAIAAWMRVNGEAIYGTRPWRLFGEGPTKPPTGMLNEDQAKPFTGEDVRFTRSGEALHAFFLDWPQAAAIGSLGRRSLPDGVIEMVLFQDGRPLRFTRDEKALNVELPQEQGLVPRITVRGRGII